MTKWYLPQECKIGLTLEKHIIILKEAKSYYYLNRIRKSIWKYPVTTTDISKKKKKNTSQPIENKKKKSLTW